MMDEKLRFKLRRGDLEVELEGESKYVREKFEELLRVFTSDPARTSAIQQPLSSRLGDIMEKTEEGRLHLIIPAATLTSKEAVALFLYAIRPKKPSDKELADTISSGWKTIKAEAVRARASEMRRDGKLISEDGRYTLSGAGVQWVENELLAKIKNPVLEKEV